MTPFLDDETFLLQSEPARRLYHEVAAGQPIYDYHSHLPAGQIAADHVFPDLHAAWLAGDHYKWRAMRANGVPERLVTGDAPPYEKFLAFAATVPRTIRNPLYHWTNLELRRTFGITDLLDETTAASVWHRANEQLAAKPVRQLLAERRVAVVCTTDDPADRLDDHATANRAGGTRVYPTFRPDKALAVDQPTAFNAWVDRLSAVTGVGCGTLDGLLAALDRRHADFHAAGGRLSDHGLSRCDADDCTDAQAGRTFDAARGGTAAAPADAAAFRSHLMLFFGRLNAARGWTQQLHLGALRNASTRGVRTLGPDTGFDSIGDGPQAASLARYLDRLDVDGRLPRTVLYNVNPSDNYALATLAGNFQDGTVPGKVQFGSGWWFLDQKQGMEWQLDALSNCGLLSRFVGMLTDSRSFLSFPRHEYFRRILCNLIGRDVVHGELPDDMGLLGRVVADVCYGNAHRYFGLDVPTPA